MTRLFLLDPSMIRVGGHHFQQTGLFADAALRRGFEPIVAAHRRVSTNAWPVACRVEPTFRHSIYIGCSVTERMRPQPPLNPLRQATEPSCAATNIGPPNGSQHTPPWNMTGLWRRIGAWWRQRRSRRVALALANSLEEFFRQLPPHDEDLVLMPTVTEFDLVGIVEYLTRNPLAQRTTWCLVFHFPLVNGPWNGDDSQQARMGQMREHFTELLRRVPQARFQFFATTPQLVDQYRRLEVAPFELAPPPVRAPLVRSPRPDDGQRRPLRVICAGGFRNSKSRLMLTELIDELERDNFADGRLQLWMQSRRVRQLSRWSGGRHWMTADPCGPPPPADARLIHVRHPLPADAYERLLSEADIALLAYRVNQYASLHSGVMAECLAYGIPTVVPEQTWMAWELNAETGGAKQAPGRTASTAREYVAALREIAENHEHYLARAIQIAPDYAAKNSADAVLASILKK